jgi:hypothetical protein
MLEVATGHVKRLTGLSSSEWAASLSPDGTKLSCIDDNRDVKRLRLETGQADTLARIIGPRHRATGHQATRSPDSRYVAFAMLRELNDRVREGLNEILVVDSETLTSTFVSPALTGRSRTAITADRRGPRMADGWCSSWRSSCPCCR